MTRIYLLRHGATASNRLVPYRLQGRGSDGALDELGIEQARRASDVLARLSLVAVYTSPLRRARETAGIVAAPHRLEPQGVDALTEAELGRWEGLTWEEAREHDPSLYERFMADPGTTPYPDGESFLDVQRRVSPVIADLAMRHSNSRIAIVGHNVVNRAYLAQPLGLPISLARGIRQANGGINVVQYEGAVAKVICLNACLHLND